MKIRHLILLLSSILIISIAATFSVVLYMTHKNALIDGIDNKLLSAAYCIEEILPKNYHDEIVNKTSVAMDDYLEIVDRYNKFCVKLGLQYVWSLMLVNDQIVFTSGTSTGKDVTKGDHALFFDPHTNPSIYKEAFDTMKIQYSTFHDKWGAGRMVLIPKLDNKGRRYLLASSMGIDDLDILMRKTIKKSLIISSIILLTGLIVSFILSKFLSKPIIHLTEITEDIARGNLDHRIKIGGSSELINLSRNIEIMAKSIREKIKEIEEKNIILKKDISKRKEIEVALKESEERFRSLVENTSDFIWETDAQGKYTYISPNTLEILGYEPSEILGKTPFDFMDESEAKRVEVQFCHVLENRDAIVTLENSTHHKDGHVVILETSGVPIIDSDGTFQGYRGIDRDITMRKKIERKLQKSEELYRSFFDTTPMAFIVWDKDCRIIEWNTQAEKIFGYKMAETKERKFIDLIIPETEKEDMQQKAESLLNGEIPKNDIRQHITKNGTMIWCEWNSARLRDENGEITGVMSLGLNVTERIKTENQLKESERTYREIFEGSNDVIYIHDIKTGAIIDVNSKVSELFGYKPSELFGKTVELLSVDEPPYTAAESAQWIRKSIEEGPQIFEWMARNKKGEAFWVEVSLKKASITGKDRLMAVVRDIRQRKAAEIELTEYREHLEDLVDQRAAEIKAKNKELEMFTYSVSHDLKAPLRGIDGYSRLLVEEYSDRLDEEGLFFLNNVRQGTTQMNKLIEDLLAYSRMERKEIHHTSIDLNSLVENLVSQRTHDIEQYGINLKIDVPFRTIESDTETLRQVLTNYLDNAIKYSKKGITNTVTIGGSQDDDYWTLWVKDSGIGFDPKYLDRIFEIFQRLHRAEEYPGTGVGLAIVRKAVERIGGRVRANSFPGKGSTFYLDIPKTNHATS